MGSARMHAHSPEPIFWAAPDIAKAGYRVFPIAPGQKRPSVDGGFYGGTLDQSKIAYWISEENRGRHNVAIATGLPSDLVVIEADTPEAYAEMEEKYGPPAVKTKRGGHWYFKHPADGKVRSRAVEGKAGLDRKGDGGYVLVPPSLGRTWTNGIPEKSKLPELPPELRGPKQKSSEGRESKLDNTVQRQAAAIIADAVRTVRNGKRHEHLMHLCGVLLSRGVAFEDAERILIEAWSATGGDLAERAEDEIPNTLRTTEEALADDRATGVPSMEQITPGLYGKLEEIFGWKVRVMFGSNDRRNITAFNLTDLGNAERLIYHHGHNLRYCWLWSKWLVWDGKRWMKDDSGEVYRLAKETVASIYQEAASATDEERRKALAKHAVRSEAGARIKEMVDLARSDVPVMPDELDGDPDFLNCENGTIDLRTGELREHRREDLITKIAPVQYRPDAAAPAWEAFLERVLPSEELRGFVQRAAGYSATGDTSEQCMFINHGIGANGKSTFQEAISRTLGDYAMRAPTEMLLTRRTGGIPNDVARLKGARFVSASETEEGRRLAESLIKDLTGQDTITARFMRAEFFDFRPTHKLWLSTNHKPEIRGTDNAIWRRIRLIPWSVAIPPAEQDKKLPATLRRELPGILAWIVRGCLEWRREGLRPPDEVRRATVEYRAEMDLLAGFIADCCKTGADHRAYASDLYKAYKLWCDDTGERHETQTKFGRRLTEKGYENGGKGGARGAAIRLGLVLNEEWDARIKGQAAIC